MVPIIILYFTNKKFYKFYKSSIEEKNFPLDIRQSNRKEYTEGFKTTENTFL